MCREQCSPPMFVLFIIGGILGAIIVAQKLSADTKVPVLPVITKSMFSPFTETAPFIIKGKHGQPLACVIEDKEGNGRLVIYGVKGQKIFDTDNQFIHE